MSSGYSYYLLNHGRWLGAAWIMYGADALYWTYVYVWLKMENLAWPGLTPCQECEQHWPKWQIELQKSTKKNKMIQCFYQLGCFALWVVNMHNACDILGACTTVFVLQWSRWWYHCICCFLTVQNHKLPLLGMGRRALLGNRYYWIFWIYTFL